MVDSEIGGAIRLAPPAGPAAFDGLAEDYDARFSASPLGRLLRAAVWRHLDASFAPGERLLELGCGTGIDALHLVRRGLAVDAIDASAGMLTQARRRWEEAGRPSGLRLAHAPAERLAELPELEGPYDGAFASFGVLNCIADLPALGTAIAQRLRPGARLLLVPMGPVCVWELLGFGLRLDPRALRRLRPNAGPARIGGMPLRLAYPGPARLDRALAPGFRPLGRAALGLLLPPTDQAAWLRGRPRALEVLAAVERRIERLPLADRLSDHYVARYLRLDGQAAGTGHRP
ncbi:MAG: methyltransferase domain-containing protein [Caldilineae bacterium]|nr:methyltransferase domain-containing protein [Chloroflexota bacterium]MCB9177470.1 methyltransferase domain-containing protein [Caldilineae bacterium]